MRGRSGDGRAWLPGVSWGVVGGRWRGVVSWPWLVASGERREEGAGCRGRGSGRTRVRTGWRGLSTARPDMGMSAELCPTAASALSSATHVP